MKNNILTISLLLCIVLSATAPQCLALSLTNDRESDLGAIHDANSRQENEEQWHYFIGGYGYIFGINGDVTIKNTPTHLATTPVDILENLDKVDAIFQLHIEARHGRWDFFTDSTYLKVTMPISQGKLSGSISPEIAILDFGTYYSLWGERYIARPWVLQGLVAARVFSLKSTIVLDNIANISGKQTFVAPMVGGRFLKNISKNWDYDLRIDIGGFGVDDMTRTWDVYTFLNYSINNNWSAMLGWHSMGMKNQRGKNDSLFKMNTKFWGPLLCLRYYS